MDPKTFVEKSLAEFLSSQSVFFESAFDEVIVSYILNVIELITNADAFCAGDAVDIEEFIEIMTAYIPEFISANREKVMTWLFDIVAQLKNLDNKNKAGNDLPQDNAEKLQKMEEHVDMCQCCALLQNCPANKENANDQLEMLLAMFPSLSYDDATGFIEMSKGDLQRAAECILEARPGEKKVKLKSFDDRKSQSQVTMKMKKKPQGLQLDCNCQCHINRRRCDSESAEKCVNQANTDCLDPNVCADSGTQFSKNLLTNDLKQKIIHRYSFVSTDTNVSEHRPFIQSEEPKKLMRYLDGRIVSTKGERRIDIKEPESADMKKTYINLKPAKKYKFH